jgi:NarL family two-component system response regulator LiaR
MISVLIADDHAVVRRGLAMFLTEFDDLKLVGEAVNGAEAIRLCNELHPHVLLLDMALPDLNGIVVTQTVRTQNPTTEVVVLTGTYDDNLVLDALQAGAIGYIHKDASVSEMVNAIRSAHAGKPALSSAATQSLINLAAPCKPAPHYNLTERERAILRAMVEGLNNQEIADRLFVSRATVKASVSTILSKLGVESRIDAVRLALQESLVNQSK